MVLFRAAHGWGGGDKKTPLPKMSHTYISMMKLGTVIYALPKEDTKNILMT